MIVDASKMCIYCGRLATKVRKGEHVIQGALGGAVGFRQVCSDCNNKMSVVDKELASMSPLWLVAWQELDKTNQPVWDYSEERDVLFEGCIVRNYEAVFRWPQVVLLEKGLLFSADWGEIQSVGENNCNKKFYTYLMQARETLGTKEERWIWQRVIAPLRHEQFPPRVYTPHTFSEFDNKMHFICKYTASSDKERILHALDNCNSPSGHLRMEKELGSIHPEFTICWRPRYILRALVKLGINLLAYICEKTVINKYTFGKAIAFVLDDKGDEPEPSRRDSGFVVNEDIRVLGCPKHAHKFRLTYDQSWHLDCAFFGGRIGATVTFPGPNYESWTTADVTVPLGGKKWDIKRFKIVVLRPLMRVEWRDIGRVIPSVPLKNVRSVFRRDVSKSKIQNSSTK